MRRLLLCLFILVPLGVAQAQDGQFSAPPPDPNTPMPPCGPKMDGQVMCKFGTLYECQYISPNSMERRTGWRWKGDIMRACATRDETVQQPSYSLPNGFTYAPQMPSGPQSSQTMSGNQPGPQSGGYPPWRSPQYRYGR
jgi:hypothetical protein